MDQYKRMTRGYLLFKSTNDGRTHDKDNCDYYQDEVVHFFQDCWHLKDWIMNDSTIQFVVNPINAKPHWVEEYVNSNKALRICADLCNDTKHLTLREDSKRSKLDPKFGKRTSAYSLTCSEVIAVSDAVSVPQVKAPKEEPPRISVKYSIPLSDGTAIDAFQLATECVQAWEKYLKENSLI